MKCMFPQLVKNPNYTRLDVGSSEAPYIVVPCGKCNDCLAERRRVWLFRLRQESFYSMSSWFVTLTFDDEKAIPQLDKTDLQLLFKRMRKHNFKFTYYAIGEFGSERHRPHYHVVFFFKECVDYHTLRSFLDESWTKGFVTANEANTRRLNYILHYHVRPKTSEEHPEQRGFQLFSKGLGLQFLTSERLSNLLQSANNIVEDFDGRTINLPRYYRKKFDIPAKDFDFRTRSWTFLHEYAAKEGLDEFKFFREQCEIDRRKRINYNNEGL